VNEPATRDRLQPLTETVDALKAPCRRNKHEAEICRSIDEWATVRFGVNRGARFGELASRAFPETDGPGVVLFGQWLVWLFAFDDLRDEGPIGRDERATERLYATVLSGRGHPIADAFSELWQRTAPRTTRGWQTAFHAHLQEHRVACWSEARFRLQGAPATLDEYAQLRRQANGPFMFDLAEPILGVRLPDGLRETAAWQAMLTACNDVTAWCNDIASADKERAVGDVHNYVLVVAHHTGVDVGAATMVVLDRIAQRIEELQNAARLLPAEFRRLGMTQKQSCDASKVAMILLGAPRGHLEWLLESTRYESRQGTDSATASASFMSAMPSSR
jgi:hypothetical protein